MKLIGNRTPKSLVLKEYLSRITLLFALTFFAISLSAQGGDDKIGKGLFKNNCASCHNKNMKDDMTGPALGGFEERWADYPREDLYSWIRNSQAMVNAGHPRAVELWNEWKPNVMNNVGLSNEEIEHVFAYINCMADGSCVPKIGGDTAGATAGVAAETDYTWLYVGLALVLGLLALILARFISQLDYISKNKENPGSARKKSMVDILTGGGVMGFLIFAGIVFGGYYTVNKAINLGRQHNYAPEQPIKFSHKTHAGMQQIDCQYCHDGARRSKHSVIPAANTCMNCHKAVKVGSKYGTAEISKIYASIGYDPSTDKYIDGYENMSNDEIEKIFSKWIADTHVKSEAKGNVEEVVAEQWNGIVSSLTGPNDESVAGPIEWVRIHNLPDHVYFNHAQHVTVGKVECQQCHGKVEEMEIVQQHTPLSMGWCINCHRKTEVQFADNDYYDNYYEKYHKEIKEGSRDKVTVEDIGGLGCQKCHY